MARILNFDLSMRRNPHLRTRPEQTGAVVPFPGVRYERLDNQRPAGKSKATGKAAMSSSGKTRFKLDF